MREDRVEAAVFVGGNATNAEVEITVCQHALGLLEVAGEAVHDPTESVIIQPVHRFKECLKRLAHVDDDG